MNVLKKTLIYVFGFVFVGGMSASTVLAQDEDQTAPTFGSVDCLVTAYYSPLEDQEYYITGSYEGDIALNGRGTHGASGVSVFEGMIAAPQIYPFGTKVNIPGLGMGEVQDRGGAIIETEDYIRLDVWMGEGESGLSKALNWGSRQMTCGMYSSDSGQALDFDTSWVSTQLHQSYEASLRAKTYEVAQAKELEERQADALDSTKDLDSTQISASLISADSTFTSVSEDVAPVDQIIIKGLTYSESVLQPNLGLDQTGDAVRKLQQLLSELDYYHAAQTGYYEQLTMDAVRRFQLDHGLIHSDADSHAGYFDQATYEALLNAVNGVSEGFESDSQEKRVESFDKPELPHVKQLSAPSEVSSSEPLHFLAIQSSLNESVSVSPFARQLQHGDFGEDVLALQRLLMDEGYLPSGLDTGYYGDMTAQAVFDFQFELGIVEGPLDLLAGRVDERTMSAFNQLSH